MLIAYTVLCVGVEGDETSGIVLWHLRYTNIISSTS